MEITLTGLLFFWQIFMPFLLLLDVKKKFIGKGVLYVLACYIFIGVGASCCQLVPLWLLPFLVLNVVILGPLLMKEFRAIRKK